MVFCNLGRKDETMVHVLSIEDAIQDVVCEAFEADKVDVDAQSGLGMFTALRGEFPQATIITLSLTALLEATHASVQSLDE
jgi:hypothetical protein